MKLQTKDWITLFKLFNDLKPNEVGDRMANALLDKALIKIRTENLETISEIELLQDKADRESMPHKQELTDCEQALIKDPNQQGLISRKAEISKILNMLQTMHILSVEKIFQNEKMDGEIEIKFTKQEKEALNKQFEAHGLKLLNRNAYMAISESLV